MFAPGGGGERWEPAQDARTATITERVETMQSPEAAPGAAFEEAPAAARSSDSRAVPTAPAATLAGVPLEASALAAAPEMVVRSSSASRIEWIPAIAPRQSQWEAAESASVVPRNGRPPATGVQLVIPTAVNRTGSESAASFPPVDSGAGARSRMPATDSPAAAPVIHVSIGRVEVRAEFPAPAPRPNPRQPQAPKLSIEEYARQRSEGKR